jgi:hypothetical protein
MLAFLWICYEHLCNLSRGSGNILLSFVIEFLDICPRNFYLIVVNNLREYIACLVTESKGILSRPYNIN